MLEKGLRFSALMVRTAKATRLGAGAREAVDSFNPLTSPADPGTDQRPVPTQRDKVAEIGSRRRKQITIIELANRQAALGDRDKPPPRPAVAGAPRWQLRHVGGRRGSGDVRGGLAREEFI